LQPYFFAIGHQVGDLLGITSKSQQVVDQLEMPEVLGQIPWGGKI
jgi:hypothetical protein